MIQMMSADNDFDLFFNELTGHSPFPWQRHLFARLVSGVIPRTCSIPTGLGKTSIMSIWLLALARRASNGSAIGFPRRLVYVVNRRTVVDQSTSEATRLRQRLLSLDVLRPVREALASLATRRFDGPLAISTLRGEFADNAEWRTDPARPAIVVGTVDMIGSRLLFSGYGVGYRSRPLHAALLGCDTLIVHDEAHLEPVFDRLLEAIAKEQTLRGDWRPVRILSLSATSRSADTPSGLTDDDWRDERVRTRVFAKKWVAFHETQDESLADEVIRLALSHRDGGLAILVYLRTLDSVERVSSKLKREVGPERVETLTGTLRGYERYDLLRNSPVFSRFLPSGERPAEGHALSETVYLVCTSAGEVGINLNADHLVCDLVPFDNMVQRFGRVNRFGTGDARVDVVWESSLMNDSEASSYDRARRHTLRLLGMLPQRSDGRHDASPASLQDLSAEYRLQAFSPAPLGMPVTDILLDAWSLTTIRGELPGRPPVEAHLHGLSDLDVPETHVAWREEVSLLAKGLLDPEELLDIYPLKPHEWLRDRTDRVFKHLRVLSGRHPEAPVWVVSDGHVATRTLAELVQSGAESLWHRMLVLPPEVGGLRDGFLDGSAVFDDKHPEKYDVADRWFDEDARPRRMRTWDEEPAPVGMRMLLTLDCRPDALEEDEEAPTARRFRHWFVQPDTTDEDRTVSSKRSPALIRHQKDAEECAEDLVARLGIVGPEARAVVLAARWHDLGKDRRIWQRSVGNARYPEEVHAKPTARMASRALNHYRHELGTLVDLVRTTDFAGLEPEIQDLVLHLIAAHHGRARPSFPQEESYDPERRGDHVADVLREVPGRFARLQRKYGRWGLAWLESLVKAADALVSREVVE